MTQHTQVSRAKLFMILILYAGGMTVLFQTTPFKNVIGAFRFPMKKIFDENSTGIKIEFKLTKENETFRRNLRRPLENLNNRKKHSGPAYEVSDDIKIQPPSARIKAKKIFHNRSLIVWTTDLHVTPTKDLINLLTPFGVKFYHHNLDYSRCPWYPCEIPPKLKILNVETAKYMSPSVAEEFFKAYQNDSIMESVDAVFCAHPASLCEIYLPFEKGMIIIPSTRYEMFRLTVEKWNRTNGIFIKMAKKPWNVFGGNNMYDAKYLEYYTGIKAHHIPSMCDYTSATYTNKVKTFLLLRRYDRSFNKIFFENFTRACNKTNCSVKIDLLSKFSYEQLAKYRAVVNVPYQISVMTVFELYRMNVPMFFPSAELLARWQADYYLMVDRNHDGVFLGIRRNSSIIPPHPSQSNLPDPKDEYDYESILYWIQMSDYYQVMPHGIIYDSIPHLLHLLENVNDTLLMDLSKKMEEYNFELKKDLLTKWRDILLRLAENSPNEPF